ncbi:MAG TPA: DUF3309 family protein [Candidatus Udaeobacter sp.]|nr:DUF3309 family protein [Candidatus Udaeobacter sp.]
MFPSFLRTFQALQSRYYNVQSVTLRRNILEKGKAMGTILLIILILLLLGALPAWPYSSGWGYWPSGGLGLIVLILIILALTGHL